MKSGILLRLSALALMVLSGCVCSSRLGHPTTHELCGRIRNEHITWERGEYEGLRPKITDAAAVEVIRRGNECVPELRKALADKDRFVIAHVLLTQIVHGDTIYWNQWVWNGLRVSRHTKYYARPEFDIAEQERLQELWRRGGRATEEDTLLDALDLQWGDP